MTLIYGIRNSYSVFFQPILDEFNWTRGSTSLMLSLNILVYGLFAPFAGTLGDRWQPRKLTLIGIVVLALATAGCGLATQLWHFYLLFGVLAPMGTALCGTPLMVPAVTNWFAKRRQLAISLAQIGGGLSFAYGVLSEILISQLGWRPAYFVIAAIVAAILIPLYFFIFYHRPESKGLKAYGAENIALNSEATKRELPGRDWTLKTALKTYQLWMLILAEFFYWGIGNYLVLAHQVKFAQDAGYSGLFATSVFALFGIVSIGGQLAAPMADWIGKEKTITLATILAMGAVGALIAVQDTSQPWLLYLYATCSGFATGLFSPIVFAGAADIFYSRNFGAILSLLLTGVGIGGIIGPWLGGFIFDTTGSYVTAFIISMVCFGISGVFFWIAAPRKAIQIQNAKLKSMPHDP